MSNGKNLAVALSGGGHRACLFGLGALLYLVDAEKGPSIASIASVSGGSLANGAVAQSVDLTGLGKGELDEVAARVAERITGKGTIFHNWVTNLYLLLLGLLTLLALTPLCPWLFSLSTTLRVVLFVAGVFVVGWVAGFRSRVCAAAFDRALFRSNGSSARLASICKSIDHVFCATDLHAGEHVYFSGDFVCSYRFGNGAPGDIKLSTVVQASAAFPGAFPPVWLPVGRHGFQGGQPEAATERKMCLVDGGVYDNMADQWSQGLSRRAGREPKPPKRFREAQELVVVNSSAGLEWGSVKGLRVPLLGELLALLRDKSVLYDNGNSLRRMALVARFQQSQKDGEGINGALVHIPQSPLKVPKAFSPGSDERALRARAAKAALIGDEDAVAVETRWQKIAAANSAVPTTLTRFSVKDSARLLHHAYVLAMVNLHVILDYPLLEMPDESRFQQIARGEVG